MKTHIYPSRVTQKESSCVSEDRVWYSEPTGRVGLASPQKAALWEKQWFDLSLRCLKWSYCQIEDAHLEGECLTGKRANYKLRLLPWRFPEPLASSTGTPWKTRERGVGRSGVCRAGHPSACTVTQTRKDRQESQEKDDIFNISFIAKMKLK